MWFLNLVLPRALFPLNHQAAAATLLMLAVSSGGFGAIKLL